MNSTTSGRVKMAPRASVPDPCASSRTASVTRHMPGRPSWSSSNSAWFMGSFEKSAIILVRGGCRARPWVPSEAMARDYHTGAGPRSAGAQTSGRHSFGCLSLAKQRKAARPPGRNPASALREALHESPRRVHLRTRAVCRVANPRDSWGYRCSLRLAAHPDPQRPLAARFVQSLLSKKPLPSPQPSPRGRGSKVRPSLLKIHSR